MVVYGGQLMIQTWTATIPVLHLPGGFTYMPLVAGGVLIASSPSSGWRCASPAFAVDHDPNAEEVALSEV